MCINCKKKMLEGYRQKVLNYFSYLVTVAMRGLFHSHFSFTGIFCDNEQKMSINSAQFVFIFASYIGNNIFFTFMLNLSIVFSICKANLMAEMSLTA